MKKIIITGVTRGIGKALAEKFLKEGWQVIGTTTTGDADFQNPNLEIFLLDLSSPESIEKCTEAIKTKYPAVEILINNAGVLCDEEETKLVVEKLRQTLGVNLIGTTDFCERLVPIIKEHIVNISSTAGSLELAHEGVSHEPHHYPAYKISKAALNMYTVTLASHLAPSNVFVSSIHPGWVKTDMGGDEASLTTEEAATGIFDTIFSIKESGLFWYQGKRLPW